MKKKGGRERERQREREGKGVMEKQVRTDEKSRHIDQHSHRSSQREAIKGLGKLSAKVGPRKRTKRNI